MSPESPHVGDDVVLYVYGDDGEAQRMVDAVVQSRKFFAFADGLTVCCYVRLSP
jgi:hypothetical protein